MRLTITIFILIGTSLAYAQIGNASKVDVTQQTTLTTNATLNLINDLQSTPNFTSDNNGIFIQQIGVYNKAYANIKAEKKDMQISQEGNFNKAALHLKAEQVVYNLTQRGDHIGYFAFSVGNPQLISHQVTQTGNNLNLVVHGQNTLYDKLKLNMQGENRSLIIRNFE